MKKILYYIPYVLLVLTYATHSIQSFIGTPDKLEVLDVLPLNHKATLLLLILAGIHDGFVTVLLLFKERLLPKLPSLYLYLWVGLWPIAPRLILWFGGKPFEWFEALIFLSLSVLSYYLLAKKQIIKNIKTQ